MYLKLKFGIGIGSLKLSIVSNGHGTLSIGVGLLIFWKCAWTHDLGIENASHEYVTLTHVIADLRLGVGILCLGIGNISKEIGGLNNANGILRTRVEFSVQSMKK